ncbi:MAG: 30S ribosomal protein S12 methylthiotransferase RimO [Bacteroidota bacterium]
MKTKSRHKDQVNIITMGCSKNLVDSEVIFTQLKANDIDVSHERNEGANVVIINTCGFINDAKQESIDTILQYANAKEEGLVDKVYVTGCLSQRYKDDLKKEIPSIDSFFGTNEVPELLSKFKADYKNELLGERIITTSKHYAYLKISEGCDRPCSFCAIPLIRGKHKSRTMESLVKEATNLAAQGVKELLIIAQDSTYYGLDVYGKRELAKLLQLLSDVDGIEWIRLHYAFPAGFPDDVLEVMANNPKVCNYLDIPLQHASSRLLKSMKRGIDAKKTSDLLKKVRSKVPGIAIRTTMIVGYPGETEDDFNKLLKFIKEFKFERLGVFTYSHEEDTAAYQLEDDVPEKVKQERADELMQVQAEISYELNQEKVGWELKVLVDRYEDGVYYGRTEYDSPDVDNEVIIASGNNHLNVGDFITVKITAASEFDLTVEPV